MSFRGSSDPSSYLETKHQTSTRHRAKVLERRSEMWIGAIGFQVSTADKRFAGTDSLLTVELLRNGAYIFTGRLDYADQDDHERGDSRFYGYTFRDLFLDKTPPLPDGIGQIPSPYPAVGMEFSDGILGHLKCRLRIHNDDMWTKDNVDIYVRYIRLVATSFDTLDWQLDATWTYLGAWSQDVNMSTDGGEGPSTWTLNV
jgi:hypothetical protein